MQLKTPLIQHHDLIRVLHRRHNRCATIKVVRSSINRSSASWITTSDSESRDNVASSSSRTLGSFRIALAIETR